MQAALFVITKHFFMLRFCPSAGVATFPKDVSLLFLFIMDVLDHSNPALVALSVLHEKIYKSVFCISQFDCIYDTGQIIA